ncbi:MAG: tetratricopeptide repeat protein, partial [Nitrospira sp.]
MLALGALPIGCTGLLPSRSAEVSAPVISTHAAAQPVVEARAADPRAYYHFILGYQAELTQDTERAIREYLLALRADSSSIQLKTRLALLYFSAGEPASAVRFADRVVEADPPEAAVLSQMAGIYASAGQTDKALALYGQVIERTPADSEPYFLKGLLLVNAQRLDEAE